MDVENNMTSQKNDFYDSNMELLKKYHYKTFEYISEFEKIAGPEDAHDRYGESCDAEIFYTSEGKANLRAKSQNGTIVYLHDENDPEKEVPEFLEMIPENAKGVVLLTGMGLGYTPMAILEKRKDIQYIAVFDLIPDIFVKAMHSMDLSYMLSDSRLILSIGPDPDIDMILTPASLALQLESIYNLKHMRSFLLDQKRYEPLSEAVFTVANKFNLGGGAFLGGGRIYTANRFKNLTSMYKNCMIEDLKGKFKDIPAVLVAAGPSLNLNIHLLPKIKEKAVIIAVDTALPALLTNGVSPDFMTSIDPKNLTYEKFAEVLPQAKGISLISSAWVAPKVAKAFPAVQIFWTFSGRNMENWIQEMMGGSIPSGGAATVAHLNLVAAILMGCSPIVFIGQDLAYAGKTSHAANTVLTSNQGMKKFLKSKELIWTEGISGEKVPTDRMFLNFKRHFEYLISSNPGVYINSTVQGARIKGTKPMNLEDVIAKYCPAEKQVPTIIDSVISSDRKSEPFLREFRAFLKKIRTLLKIIKRSDLVHKNVINILNDAKKKNKKYRSFSSLPGALKKQLGEIDEYHKKIDGYKKIWGILDEITMEGLKRSERQKHDIEKLKDDPEQYTKWLLKNLERLTDLNEVRKNELAVFEMNLSKLVEHLETEKEIFKIIKRNKGVQKNRKIGKKREISKEDQLLKLAELYFDVGDFSLVADVCSDFEHKKKSEKLGSKSAQMYFYAGCVALIRNNFNGADKYFVKARKLDPGIKQKINGFRKKLGDEYVGFAASYNGVDENTARRMLIQGLKYSGGHLKLETRLNAMADSALKSINESFEMPELSKAADLLKEMRVELEQWINDIEANICLKNVLTEKKMAEFYRLYGTILVKENNFQEAAKNFEKAVALVDDNPEYYLLRADACFAANDFDNGVEALNKAVMLDVKYAIYWENMGDNLVKQGKINDAMAAYEQFFKASPENKMVLKKISQCFLELGQLQAAKDTLLQLKQIC